MRRARSRFGSYAAQGAAGAVVAMLAAVSLASSTSLERRARSSFTVGAGLRPGAMSTTDPARMRGSGLGAERVGPAVMGFESFERLAPAMSASKEARSSDLLDPRVATDQQVPYHEYNGEFTFLRIWTAGGMRGFRSRRIGNGGPGWSHDWPDAEHQLTQIVQAVTAMRPRVSRDGGNILTFDDPRLFQYPIAYVSEPGEWVLEEREIRPLREYLLKGGFIIFDDFSGAGRRRGGDMFVLADNMKRVLPELDFVRMDGSESIFDTFFVFDPNIARIPSGYGPLSWWGIHEDNDRTKRLIAIAGNNGDLGENWEYQDQGFYSVDLRNEAFKVGVNYLIYAMTH